jgi:protein-S-isoprenylcysteine O-methyltransferase Ste14
MPDAASPQKMTIFGVGPKLILLWLLFALPAFVVRVFWPATFSIPAVPRAAVVVAGVVLLGIGVPFWIASVVTVNRAFDKGELLTRGAYGLCRHPLYASWIVFNAPGIMLLCDCWVGLLLPLPMYLALCLLIRGEDAWLEKTFGDGYRAYRARVPAVVPVGFLKRTDR